MRRARDRRLAGWAALALAAASLAAADFARRRRRRIDLWGRVAVVTGGSRGLGLLVAEELGRRGAHVAICGRNEAALQRAARRLEGLGIAVLARACDLADADAAARFVEEVATRFGRIDLLVNNAGVIDVAPFDDLPLERARASMDANFWSAVHTTLAALPHLRARGGEGRVVNVISIGGRVAVPHLLWYDAAKFALMGFSEGLQAELDTPRSLARLANRPAPPPLRVTSVVPGVMRTGSIYNAAFGGDREREFAWFATLGSLPIASADARRAARRIVRAAERGDRLVHIGLSSRVLDLAHRLAPRLTVRAMAAMNALLPESTGGGLARGRDVGARLSRSTWLRLGDRAAERNNEEPPWMHREASRAGQSKAESGNSP